MTVGERGDYAAAGSSMHSRPAPAAAAAASAASTGVSSSAGSGPSGSATVATTNAGGESTCSRPPLDDEMTDGPPPESSRSVDAVASTRLSPETVQDGRNGIGGCRAATNPPLTGRAPNSDATTAVTAVAAVVAAAAVETQDRTLTGSISLVTRPRLSIGAATTIEGNRIVRQPESSVAQPTAASGIPHRPAVPGLLISRPRTLGATDSSTMSEEELMMKIRSLIRELKAARTGARRLSKKISEYKARGIPVTRGLKAAVTHLTWLMLELAEEMSITIRSMTAMLVGEIRDGRQALIRHVEDYNGLPANSFWSRRWFAYIMDDKAERLPRPLYVSGEFWKAMRSWRQRLEFRFAMVNAATEVIQKYVPLLLRLQHNLGR